MSAAQLGLYSGQMERVFTRRSFGAARQAKNLDRLFDGTPVGAGTMQSPSNPGLSLRENTGYRPPERSQIK